MGEGVDDGDEVELIVEVDVADDACHCELPIFVLRINL